MYLYNAKIFTLDPQNPLVSALAIRDGKIVSTGTDQFILSEFCGEMRGLDLKGQVVLPGFTDAHIHLERYAFSLQRVNCETPTQQECLQRVAERVASAKPGEWILGHGWNQNLWPEGFGTAENLDSIAPSNPVFLTAKSLHAAWANSTALRLAGLDDQSGDPPGGTLGRDEKGRLNGILYENAMDLVDSKNPMPNIEQTASAIGIAQKILWKMGITGVHDFDRRNCFQALQLLHSRGQLRLRVLKSVPIEDLPHAAALGLRSGYGDDWLKVGPVKMFADGALGPQTAAMFQPYEGSEDKRGVLLLDSEEVFEHGRQAVDAGFNLAVHAIGDRAVHEVLNGISKVRSYEKVASNSRNNRLRHRIEHVQLIHPEDSNRLAELDIIASMQPIHATSDMLMADRYWGARTSFSYAWRLQKDQGALLAFGSDAPVESPNPFPGLHAAVTRKRADDKSDIDGWIPEQRISLLEAIQGFTFGAAYAAGAEDRAGRLAPGCHADLIVLENDPFKIPSDELHNLEPSATMLAGQWVVYEKKAV